MIYGQSSECYNDIHTGFLLVLAVIYGQSSECYNVTIFRQTPQMAVIDVCHRQNLSVNSCGLGIPKTQSLPTSLLSFLTKIIELSGFGF